MWQALLEEGVLAHGKMLELNTCNSNELYGAYM